MKKLNSTILIFIGFVIWAFFIFQVISPNHLIAYSGDGNFSDKLNEAFVSQSGDSVRVTDMQATAITLILLVTFGLLMIQFVQQFLSTVP